MYKYIYIYIGKGVGLRTYHHPCICNVRGCELEKYLKYVEGIATVCGLNGRGIESQQDCL